MSSYQPLADHLAARKGNSWDASFADIERTLGRSLPPSAYRYPAWWANQNGPGHSQTYGWKSVGWRTTKLDLERRRVTFERERPIAGPANASAAITSGGVSELIERAMLISGITDRDALVAAALHEFIAQEAIRGVIELGGSQPGFEAPPRERPWA